MSGQQPAATGVVGAERPAPETVAATQAPGRRLGGSTWWKHALAVLAIIWALFPVVFLVSAAINPAGTLTSSSLLPSSFSTNNFHTLFTDPARPFWTWYRNSTVIAFIGAFGQVFIGGCAARRALRVARIRSTVARPRL